MRIRLLGNIRIHFSSRLFPGDPIIKRFPMTPKRLVETFIGRRKFYGPIVKAYTKRSGLSGYLMLRAHGDSVNGRYCYKDKKRVHLLQNWIARHDGKVLVMLISSCNPSNCDIHSESSIVMHPSRVTSFADMRRGGMRMFLPGFGYLDDNRRARHALKALKSPR